MVEMSTTQLSDYILNIATSKVNSKMIVLKLFYYEYNKHEGNRYYQDIVFVIEKESFKKLIKDFLVNMKHFIYDKKSEQLHFHYNKHVNEKRIDFLFELSSNSKKYKN